MEIKSIEKAHKLIVKIKELDSEIIKIEKMAITLAGSPTKSEINISVEDLSEKKKNILDEDGSLINDKETNIKRGLYDLFVNGRLLTGDVDKPEIINLNFNLSDVELLSILGTILQLKIDGRKTFVKQLEKLKL